MKELNNIFYESKEQLFSITKLMLQKRESGNITLNIQINCAYGGITTISKKIEKFDIINNKDNNIKSLKKC